VIVREVHEDATDVLISREEEQLRTTCARSWISLAVATPIPIENTAPGTNLRGARDVSV